MSAINNNSLSTPSLNGASDANRPEIKSQRGKRTVTSENKKSSPNRNSEEKAILHELIAVVEQISVRFESKTNPLTKKEIEDSLKCMKDFKELKLLGNNEIFDKRVNQFSRQLIQAQARLALK